MAISKNSNGIMGGTAGEGDEPVAAGPARRTAAQERAAAKTSAERSSRLSSRPARAAAAEVRAMAGDEAPGAAPRAAPRAPLGFPERKYSLNTLLAAGFFGYVLGRLLSR